MQIDFVHPFGAGVISPVPNGVGVLVISATIPLDRLQPGYNSSRIERLQADARKFVADNQLADYVMTQGRVAVRGIKT
jgi:hypothetical protein